MAAHLSIHPAEVAIAASVKPLPLGNFHLEIQAGDTRISLFGNEQQAAGLDQIATILNATFGADSPSATKPWWVDREPADPDAIEF